MSPPTLVLGNDSVFWRSEKSKKRKVEEPQAVYCILSFNDFFYGDMDAEYETTASWMETVLESGWWSVLGADYGRDGKLKWSLETGIMPGQRFLVRVMEPRWYHCGEGDYDVEHDCEIIDVEPWPLEKTAEVLEREVADLVTDRHAEKLLKERRAHSQRHNIDGMHVVFQPCFGSKQSLYDDMEMPAAVRYTLVGKSALPEDAGGRWEQYLFSGEDDAGDHQKALAALREVVRKELPHITDAQWKKISSNPRRTGW